MKKLISVVLLGTMVFCLSACTDEVITPTIQCLPGKELVEGKCVFVETDPDPDPDPDPVDNVTDEEKVELALTLLDLGDVSTTTNNLALPLSIGDDNVAISWASNNSDIIAIDGVVYRPSSGNLDVVVTLTATLSLGSESLEKSFEVTVIAMPTVVDPLDETCDGSLVLNGETVITLTQGYYFKDPEVESEFLSTNTSCPTSGDIWYEVTYAFNGGEPSEGIDTTKVGQYIATYNQRDSEYNILNSITRTINIVEDTTIDVVSPEMITVDDTRILNKIYVSTTSELHSALSGLSPGDAVILTDGTYTDVSKSVEGNGTKANPIFIMAENPGSVIINGSSQLTVKGSRMVIAGLTFTDGSPKYSGGAFRIVGNYNRLTNNSIINYNALGEKESWLNISGVSNEIDHNYFEGKATKGVMLVITREVGKEDHHHIHHNYFKDFSNPENDPNELEVIRIGTSNESRSMSYTIVEYNVFDGMDAEIENISVKAGGCEIRGNLVINSASLITLRHGVDSIVEDNIIIGNDKLGTGGIRIYDTGHIIRNNYIYGINSDGSNFRGGIVIHSGGMAPGGTTAINGQWTPYDILIQNNTIINCNEGIVFEDSKSNTNYGPKDIHFDNNFIWTDDSNDAIFKYNTTGVSNIYEETITFSGDVYFGGTHNTGNGTLTNTGIDLSSFSTEIPTTTMIDGLIYYTGLQGAKELEMLEVIE